MIVALALLPALALAAYSFADDRARSRDRARETALQVTRLVAANEAALFRGTRDLLATLSQIDEVRGRDEAVCAALFRRTLRQHSDYVNLGVASENGDVWCSGLEASAGVNLQDRPWLRQALETNGFAVGGYQIGRITGQETVNAGYAFTGAAGRDVLFAAIDLSALASVAATADLPAAAALTVLDGNGTILVQQPDPERWVGQRFPGAEIQQGIHAQHEGAGEYAGIDGVRRLYAFAPVEPGIDVFVATGIPLGEAYAASTNRLLLSLAGLGAAALTALTAAWLLGARMVVRPIAALVQATRRLAGGELASRADPAAGSGEIGELASAFNEMAARLEQQHETMVREAAALRDANEQLGALIEHSPLAIVRFDRDGHVTLWNPAAERIFGWSAAEAVGGPPPFVSPELRDQFEARLARILSGAESTYEIEVSRVRTDGSPIEIGVAAAALHGEADEVAGAISVITDITQRKRAEAMLARLNEELEQRVAERTAALAETEARYRSVVENATEGIFRTTLEGRFTAANDALARMLGFGSTDELLAETPSVSAFYADETRREELLDLLQREGSATGFETPVRTRDGGTAVFSLNVHWAFEAGGQAAGLEGTVTDITEAKRLEEEISDLYEHAPCGYHSLDGDGRFVRVNATEARWLGCTKEQLLGRQFSEILTPAGLEVFRESLPRFKERGAVDGLELELARQDGSTMTVLLHATALYDANGRYVMSRSTFVDITHRKAAEAALRSAKEEADAANRGKSEFLSRMSHELRTPLNAILGFGQLLELEELGPDQTECVDHILRGGHHLLDLINEVLDLSRIEAGRLSLSTEPIDVREVVGESLALVQPQAAEAGIALDFDHESYHQVVLADRQRLKQILVNLLANAVKYNRDGGSVELTCAEVAGERLAIRVADTGLGIPPDQLERLFDPFERLGAEATGAEGTGLGLTVSRGLAEAMGGAITVESTPGEGSVFAVELPLAATAARARRHPPGPATDSPPAPARGTVLQIGDNPSNLALVQSVLERRPDVRLLSAADGRLGLELAREHRPDLILTDLHLPDMSGADVIRQIRASASTSEIPVVVLSADATPAEIKRLLAAGARAYLTKPLDLGELLRMLDAELGSEGEAR